MRRLALFASLAAGAIATTAMFAAREEPKPLAIIPYKLDHQLIIIETRINGSPPRPFILDTGASHTVFTPALASALGLTLTPDKPTTGTGKGEIAVLRSEGVMMQLAGFKLEIPAPWIIDLANVPIPKETAGLIGAELFKQFVVRIDPQTKTLRVFAPDTFRYTGGGSSIPLLLEGDKLFLEARVVVGNAEPVTRKLRIDTGSESSINDEIVLQSPERRSSTLGGGLGESFEGYSGLLAEVKIGAFEFKNMWATGGHPALIGMELLRRFILTFDAPHGRLYLEPTRELSEPVPPPGG